MTWADRAVTEIERAFASHGDSDRAAGMRLYMKDVAPFLGITAPVRRAALREVFRDVGRGSAEQAEAAALRLWAMPEREYQYAAVALLGRHVRQLPERMLPGTVADLVTTKPWWDTVDDLNSQVINPMILRHPALLDVMWTWNHSDDQWLIRASIQHQRGRGRATDAALLLALCEPHVADRRFFVAKAIGWALRDLSRIDPESVEGFLVDHPGLPRVAVREAERGLARVRGAASTPAKDA